MPSLNRKARIALKAARTGLKAYGATQRARGRAAARNATVGLRRGLGAGTVLGGALVYVLDRRGRRAPGGADGRQYDDVTLTRKVETEIFRDPAVPKGRISVNTEHGVVYLRGQVDPEQIESLAKAAAKVGGVEKVENLLHPPGTPAPMKD